MQPVEQVSLADLARWIAPTVAEGDSGRSGEGAPEDEAPAAVAELARRHGVLALLPAGGAAGGGVAGGGSAGGPGSSGDTSAAVRRMRRDTLGRLTRARADLAVVARVAGAVGAPVVALKGAVLASWVYPSPQLRPFADVDVLTNPESFGDVLSGLESAGGIVTVRNWDLMTSRRLSEVTVLMPAGTALDLHWHMINRARLRHRYRLDTDRLLEQAGEGPVEGVGAPDPVAHLGYICWHATQSGGTRLLWAVDTELVARRLRGCGTELRAWAMRAGIALPVAVALDFAAVVFPGGAAAELADHMARSPWRDVNRRLKEVVFRRPVGRFSGAFLPQATRSTTWQSLGAVRLPLQHARPAPDINLLHREGGGLASRRAYIAEVAARRI